MPFEIVRNDIASMHADAIVNTTNSRPVIGWGVDSGLHKKAGAELINARRGLGCIPVGQAALSPAFGLNARFVIHTVSPNWRGGDFGEVELLKSCYNSALRLALEHGCESVAFPLLSAGNRGFPKELALKTAVDVFSAFLLEDDIHIYLVVFGREELALSEKLFSSVKSYIDENYIEEKRRGEYGYSDRRAIPPDALFGELRKADFDESEAWSNAEPYETETLAAPPDHETDGVCRYIIAAPAPAASGRFSLEELLVKTDEGFSESLLRIIAQQGKKDAEVYKKANIDRKLFSKIRSNPAYKPSKATALAFALALELNLDDTKELIGRAGYALTHSSKFDIIVEYFIIQKNYDIYELNEVLFSFDQPLLGY